MSYTLDVVLRYSGDRGALEEAWCDLRADGDIVFRKGGRGMVGPFDDVFQVVTRCLGEMRDFIEARGEQQEFSLD